MMMRQRITRQQDGADMTVLVHDHVEVYRNGIATGTPF